MIKTYNNKKKVNRTEWIPRTRVTPDEKKQLMLEFDDTYHSSLAGFVREKLFAKQITTYHRRKIDSLMQLGEFRNELNRIGNNVNQIAKMMNIVKNGKLLDSEVTVMVELLKELASINEFLDDIKL